jgi:hypothetical protein
LLISRPVSQRHLEKHILVRNPASTPEVHILFIKSSTTI